MTLEPLPTQPPAVPGQGYPVLRGREPLESTLRIQRSFVGHSVPSPPHHQITPAPHLLLGRPCLGVWDLGGKRHCQGGAGSSGDRRGVGSSCSLPPDTSGHTMLAVSRPSRGTGLILCQSQETGHLSRAFVHSGGSPATGRGDQAPGRP